ncbi:MAG: cysteine desulfurase-like protein [Desulfoferrobacter sp.]
MKDSEKLYFTNLRKQFPALQETDEHDRPYVYFDGPGGTQAPQSVLDAMVEHFRLANANHGGLFITSARNDAMVEDARNAMADFFNAPSNKEIVFGANMTSLTFSFSRAIGRMLRAGDEIIVTRQDHDANIAPWVALQEQGINVKWADFKIDDCRLDLEQLASLVTDKTRLIAVGYASNAVGTINPVKNLADLAHSAGAWLWVDAVHFAPHGPIDVQQLGCDFLVCSAYKFFGPHVGVLWGRDDLLETMQAYKVRPASPETPYKFETGTLNHEGLAGVIASVDYISKIGQDLGVRDEVKRLTGQWRGKCCQEIHQAMDAVAIYERGLVTYMLDKMQSIPGIKIYGITNPAEFAERCPTVAFTIKGLSPQTIASYLGKAGIFVWNGNYYALSLTERLGVEDSGGMVRVGLVHYNTKEEIDRFLTVMNQMKV